MARPAIPAIALGSIRAPAPPGGGGGFAFCPSPRKVKVAQRAPPAEVAPVAAEPAPQVTTDAPKKKKIQVVREEMPLDYEPTQQEIEEYAAWLGMDLETEKHLFWIARQALKSPCPEPWRPCLTEEDEVFYFNFATEESSWDHPVDVHSKNLYHDKKEAMKAAAVGAGPVPSLCLSLPQVQVVKPTPVGVDFRSPRKLTARAKQETSMFGDVQSALLSARGVAPSVVSHVKPQTKVTVMEEEVDENWEPSQAELEEYAEWMGMHVVEERHLFWIAREALKARCPEPWKPCQLEDGEVFYFNFTTGESVWDHPCDVHFKALYEEHRTR